jgi:hypothetical protein
LRLWSAPGQALETLKDRGVGAIGLAHVATPFQLRADGQSLGELRTTGLWLGEDGSAGTVHQVDVVT